MVVLWVFLLIMLLTFIITSLVVLFDWYAAGNKEEWKNSKGDREDGQSIDEN